jgi:hypothetical protein
MAKNKLIEVYVTEKPEGPVDKAKVQKGLVAPSKEEVAGRGRGVRYIQCWKCTGIFVVYEGEPAWGGLYICPICGAVGDVGRGHNLDG